MDTNAAPAYSRLLAAREHDPCRVLGLHHEGGQWVLRVFEPHAEAVEAGFGDSFVSLESVHSGGVFEWRGAVAPTVPYRLRITSEGCRQVRYDPYAFAPEDAAGVLHLFNEGTNLQSWRLLGAHVQTCNGVAGTRFRVWAPNAERVSVVGDFNRWDGRVHQMASLGASGVWELFLPEVAPGALYKFELRSRAGGTVLVKSDPYAQAYELRPATAARICAPSQYVWNDAAWLEQRVQRDWLHAPLCIYEVHAGSWRRHAGGRYYSYSELARYLVPYVRDMGYTHIELMPVTEHPLDESWGYQTTGYFAATSRFGPADGLRALIDACHQAGIGVILDWVPGHFASDEFALAHFDGTALYEHDDVRLKRHPDWGTHIFNYSRNEVRSFLLSSAYYWLSEFHADGLRVDAVASMLYLDYSRAPGEWLPNRHGGRENLEAMEFLRVFNTMVHREFPGVLTFAEESTAWPMVSRPVYAGGLGFSMKWNMGWMNDTLAYLRHDPVHRRYHHALLTFGQLYAYSENFVLPLSHDEVVHGKRALLAQMPGDAWQQHANLRLLYTVQAAMPGKKLGFMGNEFGQRNEWYSQRELDWGLLSEAAHCGIQCLVRDLNRLHLNLPALHELDFEASGFTWIDCHDSDQSVIGFIRRSCNGTCVIVVLNFTPVPRFAYRIGVPAAGDYREIFNSDSRYYGGSDIGNGEGLRGKAGAWMGQPAQLELTLPPLAGLMLVHA